MVENRTTIGAHRAHLLARKAEADSLIHSRLCHQVTNYNTENQARRSPLLFDRQTRSVTFQRVGNFVFMATW